MGDYIEVTVQGDGLLLTPKKLIDKSQAYFWTEEWQKGERQADEDNKAGRVRDLRLGQRRPSRIPASEGVRMQH